jgi:hypothetical protein
MYYLWVLHYSLIKGIYRKRWKGFTNSVDGLAFCCLLILSLAILILIVDKELLWNFIRKRLPLGPMFKGILILFIPGLFFLLSGKLTHQKIKIIRKVIEKKGKIRRIHSILYVSFFVGMLVFSIIIAALSRTPI